MNTKKFLLILTMMIPQIVFASPNASISTNEDTIEKGKSVTAIVTLTDTAAWNIKINGSGAGNCSSKEADVTSDGKNTTKTFSLSCTSESEGLLTFSLTGDITSEDGETKDISLNKEVSVTALNKSNEENKTSETDSNNNNETDNKVENPKTGFKVYYIVFFSIPIIIAIAHFIKRKNKFYNI